MYLPLKIENLQFAAYAKSGGFLYGFAWGCDIGGIHGCSSITNSYGGQLIKYATKCGWQYLSLQMPLLHLLRLCLQVPTQK
ncbi:hypothetical protein MKX03_018343, partial [Papaver bracteatum]